MVTAASKQSTPTAACSNQHPRLASICNSQTRLLRTTAVLRNPFIEIPSARHTRSYKHGKGTTIKDHTQQSHTSQTSLQTRRPHELGPSGIGFAIGIHASPSEAGPGQQKQFSEGPSRGDVQAAELSHATLSRCKLLR